MLRIEVHDPKNDHWNPAFMAVAGTNLTPERASTFETPEAAFEKCAALAKLRPEARYRIVDAASGVVIWGPGETIDRETGAVYLNGGPAMPLPSAIAIFEDVRRALADPKAPTLAVDSLTPRYAKMTIEQFAAATLLEQIIASQEEFVAGLAELRKNLSRISIGVDLRDDLIIADSAAREILANLRALAKPDPVNS